MKSIYGSVAILFCVSLLGIPPLGGGAEPDAYAPLKLYDGSWRVKLTTNDKKPDLLVNHCTRTGTFFVCEQELNGNSVALIVFLPTGKSPSGAQEYRTLAALPDATRPDEWGHLVIDGNAWTYTWTQKDGDKLVPMRNVNTFKDGDHIHFELQKLEDGTTWKTQMAGDEERVN
jgi:hypothetical protein